MSEIHFVRFQTSINHYFCEHAGNYFRNNLNSRDRLRFFRRFIKVIDILKGFIKFVK